MSLAIPESVKVWSQFIHPIIMWARNLHFAINIGVLGLFGWQAITGVQVVQKIISQL